MMESDYEQKIDWGKLPQAAGVCTLDEATADGLSVNECVDRLKRYHYSFHRLWNILLSKLTAEPVYELKMTFSYHAYLCSENVSLTRDRVAEMRHPPLGLDKIPHPELETLYEEINSAPKTHQLVYGIYQIILPDFISSLKRHLTDTHPLADAPSNRIVRMALSDLDEITKSGTQILEAYAKLIEEDDSIKVWGETLQGFLACCGSIDGSQEMSKDIPEKTYSNAPTEYDVSPARDHRFPDPYNMGVHAEQYLYNEAFSDKSKTLMMYYKRLREIDVPEMMATILVQTSGKQWQFYQDLTRQLWDEARHAIMGEAGYHKLGIDWGKFVRINFTWSKGLNEQLSPQERHAVLWFIEQGLMNKTGKRYEWEVGLNSGDSLSGLFQDYDWADEVLHARIGRDWYVKNFETVEKAAEYGSACWSKVVSDWDQWAKDGLTEHFNWWPDLYKEFCEKQNYSAVEDELKFNDSYKETRADLQRIAASG